MRNAATRFAFFILYPSSPIPLENIMPLSRRLGLLIGGTLIALAGYGAWLLAQDHMADPTLAKGMITPAAEQAIKEGLAYLARNQHQDGSWGSGPQFYGNVAVTSLCGLAFMAGGNQPGRGQYGKNVTRAIEYILDQEDPGTPGFLRNTHPNAMSMGPMYGQGFGTLFLAEAQGMVTNPVLRQRLRGTLERAVKLIIKTQNHQGGWRYLPRAADADISVTICQIMALRAARNAGIAVPKAVADKCIQYVQNCQDVHVTGGFRYQQGGGARFGVGFARTAAGIVALYSAGQYEGENVRKGLEFLKKYEPGPDNNKRGSLADPEYITYYFYGHYYAVQAMWIRGGDYWRSWYPAIRNDLLKENFFLKNDGSWYDKNQVDPHYCTAMALIILQVPNNYLPILQR